MVDLDEVTDNSGALHQSFDPVAQANITPFDRGPKITGTISVQRV